MTPEEKVQYVRDIVRGLEIASPSGPIFFKIYSVGHPDNPDEWTMLTTGEQRRILKKLEENREIHNVQWEGERGVWVEIGPPPPTFDESFQEFFEENKRIEVQTVAGPLKLNKETGLASFNNVSCELNPGSQEYKILVTLMSDKNKQATYSDLLEGNDSKTNKRNLGFLLRNLKENLGILPAKNRKNKDIFVNLKNYGYRLKLKSQPDQDRSQ